MNGFELLEHFKSEPRFNRIPVIILTGADLDSEQQKQLSSYKTQMIPKGLLKEKDLLEYLHTALADIKKNHN